MKKEIAVAFFSERGSSRRGETEREFGGSSSSDAIKKMMILYTRLESVQVRRLRCGWVVIKQVRGKMKMTTASSVVASSDAGGRDEDNPGYVGSLEAVGVGLDWTGRKKRYISLSTSEANGLSKSQSLCQKDVVPKVEVRFSPPSRMPMV
uniref:Uncharacterized protein n=1 Tax=Oryza brachyantha TaxID=4533 RepID=J3MK94_ORYBR